MMRRPLGASVALALLLCCGLPEFGRASSLSDDELRQMLNDRWCRDFQRIQVQEECFGFDFDARFICLSCIWGRELDQFAANAAEAITTCEAKCKSRVEGGKPMWIAAYDDCITHCRDLNGVSDVSKRMKELENRNFRTGWEGDETLLWYCRNACTAQTPNIVEFRDCMEVCHFDPKTKAQAEQAAKLRDSRREKDGAPEEEDKEPAGAL